MADQTEIATVLPKELRLGVPPKMPQARSYLFRQQSTLSTYQSGNTIQINIPRLQRSYLRKDSYLRFKVNGFFSTVGNVPNSAGLCLDTAGAFGFIEKIEIFDYLGSTVLESISGVPQLSALLLDLGLNSIMENNNGNASCGLAQDYNYSGTTAFTGGAAAGGPAANQASWITQTGTHFAASSGKEIVQANPTGTGENHIFSEDFAIPLPSFLGLLSEKMVPLHNGFTIVITLATKRTPFIINQFQDVSLVVPAAINTTSVTPAKVATVAVSDSDLDAALQWEISDVYMNCQILELGPVAESMIMSSTQGAPLVVHSKSMRNYVGNVKGATWNGTTLSNTGASEFTLNMNLNVASLTNILWIMRSTAQLDSLNYSSYGHRTRNFLSRWQFQYGSTTLPQSNGIQTMASSIPYIPGNQTPTANEKYILLGSSFSEGFNELQKARPFYLPSNRFCQANYMTDFRFNYNLDPSNTIGILNLNAIYPCPRSYFNIGRFAGGLNLQLANGKEGQIICGLNTNGMNTSIRGTFHPMYTDYMDNVRVDAWAEYDAFINISPGIATTVSF